MCYSLYLLTWSNQQFHFNSAPSPTLPSPPRPNTYCLESFLKCRMLETFPLHNTARNANEFTVFVFFYVKDVPGSRLRGWGSSDLTSSAVLIGAGWLLNKIPTNFLAETGDLLLGDTIYGNLYLLTPCLSVSSYIFCPKYKYDSNPV